MTSLKNGLNNLLLRLQPLLKTDVLYAARGGFWLSAGSLASSAAAFLLAVLLVNLVPKEAYGSYKYILSLLGVFSAFTLSGLSEAVSQSAAKGHDAALRQAFPRSLAWNALGGAAAFAAAGYHALAGHAPMAIACLLVGAAVPLVASFSLYGGHLKGIRDFRRLARFGALRAALPTMAVAVTLPFTRQPLALASAYLAATVAGAALAYVLTRRIGRMDGTDDPGLMPFGLHLSLMNVAGVLAVSIDKVVIFHLLGAPAVAVYAIAQALPEQIDGVVSNVRHLAMPKYAAADVATTANALPRKTLLYLLMLLPVALAYALLAGTFFRIVFPEYLEAVPYSVALGFAFLATAPSQLPMAFLAAHRDVRSRWLLGPGASVAWIALTAGLCRAFGLWGVVAAKLIVKFSCLPLSLLLARRVARRMRGTTAPPTSPPSSPNLPDSVPGAP